MAFATTHLINHAFGLASLEAMEQARRTPLGFWHIEPFNLVLLAAIIAHMGASLYDLAQRRHLRLAWWQLGQILSGALIPIWLLGHWIGTQVIQDVEGFEVNYYFVMPLLVPGLIDRQIFMSLLIWLHGCVGIHYWLRQKPAYRALKAWPLVPAILVPALSMSGFLAGGKDLALKLTSNPELRGIWAAQYDWPKLADIGWTLTLERWLILAFCALLLSIVGWRLVRDLMARRRNRVVVQYDGGHQVRVSPGTSILEASQIGGIPHASVCGGRGRCSTCRVRVLEASPDAVDAPEPNEAKVLSRLGAMSDVRLACQLRARASIRVARLMATSTGPEDVLKPMDPGQGMEREIVVLFADLRGFTQLSESRLPFDVVHLLNRYFRIMGEMIEQHGGHIDKFIGDGIMAIFGIRSTPQDAAASALRAAHAMSIGLARLNDEMKSDLAEPLRMGIGMHLGPAIVGEMGFGRATGLTAVGDTVNTASRLEASCKPLTAELIVSHALLKAARLQVEGGEERRIEVRGRQQELAIRFWRDASGLLPSHNLPANRDNFVQRLRRWRAGLAQQ